MRIDGRYGMDRGGCDGLIGRVRELVENRYVSLEGIICEIETCFAMLEAGVENQSDKSALLGCLGDMIGIGHTDLHEYVMNHMYLDRWVKMANGRDCGNLYDLRLIIEVASNFLERTEFDVTSVLSEESVELVLALFAQFTGDILDSKSEKVLCPVLKIMENIVEVGHVEMVAAPVFKTLKSLFWELPEVDRLMVRVVGKMCRQFPDGGEFMDDVKDFVEAVITRQGMSDSPCDVSGLLCVPWVMPLVDEHKLGSFVLQMAAQDNSSARCAVLHILSVTPVGSWLEGLAGLKVFVLSSLQPACEENVVNQALRTLRCLAQEKEVVFRAMCKRDASGGVFPLLYRLSSIGTYKQKSLITRIFTSMCNTMPDLSQSEVRDLEDYPLLRSLGCLMENADDERKCRCLEMVVLVRRWFTLWGSEDVFIDHLQVSGLAQILIASMLEDDDDFDTSDLDVSDIIPGLLNRFEADDVSDSD